MSDELSDEDEAYLSEKFEKVLRLSDGRLVSELYDFANWCKEKYPEVISQWKKEKEK